MAALDQPAPALMTWRLHREVVLLAGWGRAILLQLAHPLVAQGIADHSGFATDRRGHVKRLKRALLAWVHVTLVDSFLLTYERFVAPLTPAERDRYCREAGAGGPLLGIPPGILPGSV